MTDAHPLRSDLQALADIAARARRETGEGRMVDLGALESLVERVTAASRDLTAEEMEALRSAILLLVAELDELRCVVRAEHAELREKIEGIGARRNAAAAYGRPPGHNR